MAEENKSSPSAMVIPNYDRELSEQEEKTVKNIKKVLDANKVQDEVIRGRIYAKSRAFVRDVFNAGVESGVL